MKKDNFFKRFGKAVANEIGSFFEALIHGDWKTKLSVVIMGAGNLLRGQIVRGVGFLAVELAFICFRPWARWARDLHTMSSSTRMYILTMTIPSRFCYTES